jgi:hypothetical protein
MDLPGSVNEQTLLLSELRQAILQGAGFRHQISLGKTLINEPEITPFISPWASRSALARYPTIRPFPEIPKTSKCISCMILWASIILSLTSTALISSAMVDAFNASWKFSKAQSC